MRLFIVFLVITVVAAALLTGLGYVARNLNEQMAAPESSETAESGAQPPGAAPADNAEEPPADAATEDEAEAREKLIEEITAFNAAKLLQCAVDGESQIPPPAGAGSPLVRLDYRLINETPYNLRGVVLTVTLSSVTGGTREEHLQNPRWIDAETTLQERCELKYTSAERGIPLCRIRVKTAYLKPVDVERLAEEHPENWRDEVAQWE